MINPGEVRIGSYVLVTFDESEVGFGKDFISKVVAIQCLKIMVEGDLYWHPIDSISPVSLSPYILEKCGFTLIAFTDYRHQQLKGFCFQIIDGNVEIIARGLEFCNLQYLHQLQNLVFALTGQELEVNL